MKRQATLKDKIGVPGKVTIHPATYHIDTLRGMSVFPEKHSPTEITAQKTGSWVSIIPKDIQEHTSRSSSNPEIAVLDYAKADSIRLSGDAERDADMRSVSIYSVGEDAHSLVNPASRSQSPALERFSSAIRDRAVRFLSGHETLGKRGSQASSQLSTYSRDSWRTSAMIRPAEGHTPSPLAGEPTYAI